MTDEKLSMRLITRDIDGVQAAEDESKYRTVEEAEEGTPFIST